MATRTDALQIEDEIREPRYKRPFDLAVLVVAHIALAPLWVALWVMIPLAIKLDDRGPVFYSQKRIGRGGKLFTVRKFRSMVADAENGTGAVWASRKDPRITRVGRILRHTALDELPQVLNVWAGDMSLVGPRPERPQLHEQIAEKTPEFHKRLNVRPGMAGMAQVYGDYDLSPPEKLAFDLRYIRSMSLFVDVRLLTLAVLNSAFARWGHAKGNTSAPTSASSLPSNVVPFTLESESESAPADTSADDGRDEAQKAA